MVLAFTEEQKKEIEARGMTVIEFKRRIRNMGKNVDDAWKILKEWTDRVLKAWNVLVEKFHEMVDSVKLVLEQIKEAYCYQTSHRYRIVKIFSKCTGVDMRFWWNFTFKIKRWIVRSCC
jgi:hypothetical protein